jgi:hypothetical protein
LVPAKIKEQNKTGQLFKPRRDTVELLQQLRAQQDQVPVESLPLLSTPQVYRLKKRIQTQTGLDLDDTKKLGLTQTARVREMKDPRNAVSLAVNLARVHNPYPGQHYAGMDPLVNINMDLGAIEVNRKPPEHGQA